MDTLPPLLTWTHREAGTNFEVPVLIAPDFVTAVTNAGTILTLRKFERSEPFEFQAQGKVSAAMGQHGAMAYIGSEDYTLYALNMETHTLSWRFLAGGSDCFEARGDGR